MQRTKHASLCSDPCHRCKGWNICDGDWCLVQVGGGLDLRCKGWGSVPGFGVLDG